MMANAEGLAKEKKSNFALLAVVVVCLIFAVRCGIFEKEIEFQIAKKHEAYARGNLVFFKVEDSQTATNAKVRGFGRIEHVEIESKHREISELRIGDRLVCSPCLNGKMYYFGKEEGELPIEVHLGKVVEMYEHDKKILSVFFRKDIKEFEIDSEIFITLHGGWKAFPEASIPASVYSVDGSFHIYRAKAGANYIRKLEFPWMEYTYFSAFPPSLIYLFLGVTYQYALKVWGFVLVFLPLVAFWLFSRKLAWGKDAAFFLASMLYLFYPVGGIPNGGFFDIFNTGLFSHTLANFLFMLFFFFSYEFVAERKGRGFWPAVAFFLLALLANVRIFFSFLLAAPVLFALSFAFGRQRHALLISIACLAISSWLVFLVMEQNLVRHYVPLIGARAVPFAESILGMFQEGQVFFPVLVSFGIIRAFAKRELFLFYAVATAFAAFFVFTNDGLNALFPFVDGFRSLPLFFILAFFSAGAGAVFVIHKGLSLAIAIGRQKLKGEDTAAAFLIALVLPFALTYLIAFDMLSKEVMNNGRLLLEVVSDYMEYAEIDAIMGQDCALVYGLNGLSHHTVYDRLFDRLIISEYKNNSQLEEKMQEFGCAYFILNNRNWAIADSDRIEEKYMMIKGAENFTEIAYGGSNRLFKIKSAVPAKKVDAEGAFIESYDFEYGNAKIKGTCNESLCRIRIRQDNLPNTLCCEGNRCSLEYERGKKAIVLFVERGDFDLDLRTCLSARALLIMAIGVLVAFVCFLHSRN